MDVNRGYVGWSMSKRARDAYESGEMPKSKWTKKAMIEAMNAWCDENDRVLDENISKMKKDEIFSQFFDCSSWHHTSKHFNRTDFYSLDPELVEGVSRPKTDDEIAEDKARREAEVARIAEEEARREAEELERAREIKEREAAAPTISELLAHFPEYVSLTKSRSGKNEILVINLPEGTPFNGGRALSVREVIYSTFSNTNKFDRKSMYSEMFVE